MILESNKNGRLVQVSDMLGTYYYLGDDMGNVCVGAWSSEEAAREAFAFDGDLGEIAGDVEIDEQGRRVVECAYCLYNVVLTEQVPAGDDDEGWGEAAKGHADDCEWVATRAHRLDPSGPAA